jgi:hypothetical protein
MLWSRGASPEAGEASFGTWAIPVSVVIVALALWVTVVRSGGSGGVRVTGPASDCARQRCSGAPPSFAPRTRTARTAPSHRPRDS